MGTQLFISDATYNKLSNTSRFSIRKVNTIRVKGKTKAMGIYEVLPVASYEKQLRTDEYVGLFEQASELCKAGDFLSAKQAIEVCMKEYPEDMNAP